LFGDDLYGIANICPARRNINHLTDVGPLQALVPDCQARLMDNGESTKRIKILIPHIKTQNGENYAGNYFGVPSLAANRCLGIVEEKCNAKGSALTSAACKPFNS
jgi:hypothetical protein